MYLKCTNWGLKIPVSTGATVGTGADGIEARPKIPNLDNDPSLQKKDHNTGLWDLSRILNTFGALYFLNISSEQVLLKPCRSRDSRPSSATKIYLVLLWQCSSAPTKNLISQELLVGLL